MQKLIKILFLGLVALLSGWFNPAGATAIDLSSDDELTVYKITLDQRLSVAELPGLSPPENLSIRSNSPYLYERTEQKPYALILAGTSSGDQVIVEAWKKLDDGKRGGNGEVARRKELVDSWRYVSDLKPSGTSKLTQDVDFLQVVNRQRGNPDLINKIGSDKYDDIIKNYAGQCKGCDAPASSASEAVKHLPPHDEMLESLEAFTTKHHGKDGFDKVINDLKSTDPRKQKGAEFVTNALKGQDGVTAFEFKYLDDLDNTADFVLNGKNIDGKSWSVASSIDNIGNWNLSGQLKDYFKAGNFEQWFDYSRFQKSANGTYSSMSKTDAVEHIKKQYQKLFQKESKAQELFDHMGETRFKEVFGDEIQTVDDFIDDVVSDLSNSDLYGFIKVK